MDVLRPICSSAFSQSVELAQNGHFETNTKWVELRIPPLVAFNIWPSTNVRGVAQFITRDAAFNPLLTQ